MDWGTTSSLSSLCWAIQGKDYGQETLYKLKAAQGRLVGVPTQTQSPSPPIQNSDFHWWTHGLQRRCQIPPDITTQQSNDAAGNIKSMVWAPSKTKWVHKISGWDWSNYPLGSSLGSWALKTHLLLFQGIKECCPPPQTPVVQSRGCSRKNFPAQSSDLSTQMCSTSSPGCHISLTAVGSNSAKLH